MAWLAGSSTALSISIMSEWWSVKRRGIIRGGRGKSNNSRFFNASHFSILWFWDHFSVYVRWHLCTLETVVRCLLPIMPQNTENHQVNKLIFVVETKYKKLIDFIAQYIHCKKLCLSVWGFSVFLSKCNTKESFMLLGMQLEFDTLSLQLTCWQTSAFKRSGALFVFVLKGSCRIRLCVTM